LEPPVGTIGPNDPQGILISTKKLDRRTLDQLKSFGTGALVLANGILKFDQYCWEVGAPEDVQHVCAPEGHPVTLVNGVIAEAPTTGALAPKETTVCALAVEPREFERERVKIRARVEAEGDYWVLVDESCRSDWLLWLSDGPDANEDALSKLSLAVRKAFLLNHPSTPHFPMPQHQTVTVTLTGFASTRKFGNIYEFLPTDASEISMHPAEPLWAPPSPPASRNAK